MIIAQVDNEGECVEESEMNAAVNNDFYTLCDLRSYTNTQISTMHLNWFKHAVEKKKYQIIRNEVGKAKGYVLWADVSKETARRFLSSNVYPNVFYEWDEGNVLLILDVVIQPSITVKTKSFLKGLILSRRAVIYRRSDKARFLLRKSNRFYGRNVL